LKKEAEKKTTKKATSKKSEEAASKTAAAGSAKPKTVKATTAPKAKSAESKAKTSAAEKKAVKAPETKKTATGATKKAAAPKSKAAPPEPSPASVKRAPARGVSRTSVKTTPATETAATDAAKPNRATSAKRTTASAASAGATRRKTAAAASKAEPAIAERTLKPEAQISPAAPTDVREHFFHEHRGVPEGPPARELPDEYGDTKIVLLVRDPEWVFAYWEINDATRAELRLPRTGHERRIIVRMYRIDGRDWPHEAAHYFFDLDVGPYSNNWYIRVPETACSWCAELGMYDEDNNYIVIARSNAVTTPRDRISDVVDSDWMTVEATFQKLYGLSGGFTLREQRGSEEILRHLQKQVDSGLRGESPTSGPLFSGSFAPSRSEVAIKDFWLQVHTELILYGATEPDAKVTVQGRPVRLNPDGTFSLRYALPDGEQVLDVKAVSADGTMERAVTPVVRKETK
jgi:hypothetical protein